MADEKQGPSLTEPAPRWLVKVAVTMVLLIALVTIVKLLTDDPSPPRTAPDATPSVTALALPDADLLKCRVPDVTVLKEQSLAFEGTTTAIEGRAVTLEVDHWFRGEPTQIVTVEVASPETLLALSGVEFEVGKHYLVSATNGEVTLCGFSAPYNQELADLYKRAYAS